MIIYSSLFTENGSNYTLITKRTTGLNKTYLYNYTAYIQRMTWKSQTFRYNITHTFSYGLKLFTIWHTVFWWFWYCFWNFSTRFLRRVLGTSKQKNIWHFLTMSILLVWNNFIKNPLITKSNESNEVRFPYSRLQAHITR